MKTGKEKTNMNPADQMKREVVLAIAYEKLFMLNQAKGHYEVAYEQANRLNNDTDKANLLISLGTINCDME